MLAYCSSALDWITCQLNSISQHFSILKVRLKQCCLTTDNSFKAFNLQQPKVQSLSLLSQLQIHLVST